jgi:hypothetical protein
VKREHDGRSRWQIPCEQKEQIMTSNVSSTSWRDWSIATKFTVAFGLAVGAAVVAFLYLPQILH